MDKALRALIVEDSEDDAELLLRALQRAGFQLQTECVTTPEEFRRAIDEKPWDVILSDFSLPRFSGPAALALLRSAELDIPFIIVSGTVGEEVAVQVMKAGAHDFFAKGHLTRLGAAIEREVREAGLRRAAAEERRRSEEERARLLVDLRAAVAARDTFLSIASHELKTPLTVLLLEVAMLRREAAATPTTPGHRERITKLARQLDRLTALVNSLLDMGHVSSGNMVLSREELDLADVVKEVLVDSEELVRNAGCTVTLVVESARGSWDRVRMGAVVTNLLSNALKFGTRKPIDVALLHRDGVVTLRVRDHGIGIATKDQPRLFNKFERAVPERNYGGFGLGLWIVREIVEAHGGTVKVDSKEGEGATFTAEVPLPTE